MRPSSRFLAPLTAALALALGAAPAGADDVADEADLLFELGAEAYQRGEYRSALERFLASNRLVPNRNVTFNVARTYDRLGRYPEAHRYYLLALEGESDEAQRRFITAALEVLATKVAVVEVTTDPPGAAVYLQRRDLGSVGSTPRALGLAAGNYTVIVERPGYHPRSVVLDDLQAGERRSLTLELRPILGTLVIEGEAAEGARVNVAGVEHDGCRVPCEVSVPPGQHVLSLNRPGFRPYETLVDVRAERRLRVRPQLEALTGAVLIEADESGALVEIDGKAVGYTPTLARLPVGAHELRVSLAGYSSVERQLSVEEQGQQRVVVALNRLDEVTAASRRKETVADAPSSVSVIPSEELRLFAYPTIGEALRGLPGVYAWDDRAYPSVGIRGLGRLGSYGNRVLVLFDDHPTNDNWVGSSYVSYDARTDLRDVERIEVVRGPGSVLYGTNAFAGVVNVVTRPATRRLGGDIGISAVEDGVGRVRVRGETLFGKDSSLWMSVAGGRGQGREFVLQDPTTGASVTTPRSADGFEAGTVQGRYSWRWLSAQWFAHSHEKHQPTGWFETLVGDPRARQRDGRAFVEVRAEPTLGRDLQSLTRVHLNHYRYDGFFPREAMDGGLEVDRYRGSWAGLEQRFVYDASERVRVTLGGEGQLHFQVNQSARDEVDVFLDEPDRRLRVGAGYGMVDYRLERLRLSGGARLDAYSTFGSSVNPRLAAIGQPYEGGNTKLLFGKAFRAPSIYELYYNDGGFTQVASPDLRPENVLSVEVEHSHRLSSTLQVSLGAFATRTTELIVTRGDGTAASPLSYTNSQSPLATAGLEATLRREWRQGWMLEAQYTLQAARFLPDESLSSWFGFERDDDFRDVANVPSQLAALKGAVPILGRALTLGSRLTLQAPRADRFERADDEPQGRTAGFALWDVVVTGYEPRTGVRWNAGVYNAFDSVYALPVSPELPQRVIPQRGRTLLVSLDLEF
jgi:outer membrane receptor protein involved in Fe transport